MPFFLRSVADLFARRSSRHVPPLIVFGALGLFFGQPNSAFHFPALVLAFPFSLYLLSALAPSDISAFFRCWLLSLVGHSAGLYWLVNPIHDVGGLHYSLAAPLVLLAATYLACYSALAGLGMRWIRRLFGLDKPESPQTSAGIAASSPIGMRSSVCTQEYCNFEALHSALPAKMTFACTSWARGALRFAPREQFHSQIALGAFLAASFLAGLIYAGFETLCGTLFTGFPWFTLASSFVPWPAWIQMASLIGNHGLTACFAASACLGAAAFIASSRRERITAAIVSLLLAGIPPVYGELRLAEPPPDLSGPPVSIIMIQGNIDQNQKWDPQFQKSTINHYLQMSLSALNRLRATQPDIIPDLVLWPETSMPFYFHAHPEYSARLRRFAAEHTVNLAFGALGATLDARNETTFGPLYNRLYLLSSKGELNGIYDKQHLVPFGEYIPFAAFLPFLQNIAQGLDFSPGSITAPLPLSGHQTQPPPPVDAPPPSSDHAILPPSHEQRPTLLGVLICYEAIFPSLAQERVRNGATVIINISNDGWFGESSAPLQHLYLTAMRAVEQARPIARATNTGYTAAIDARGRIKTRSARLFTDETLLAQVQPSREITLYHRMHPMPEVLLIALAVLSFLAYTLPRALRGLTINTL
ncbi:MAG: apolipoprotein N-acyltransferase [Desulfovibrio sp.]|jgi:apolipoprotein N-acyltransferase|nr:apolipoprotein N-acyltransferase [Desulfovibrio sp.]